jgi:glycosyltransferase involved in cell wall biosynthesis
VLHLVLGAPGPLFDQAKSSGFSVTVLPFPKILASLGDSGLRSGPRGWRFLGPLMQLMLALVAVIGYARRLRALLAKLGPDVVHSNGIKFHVLAALADRGRHALIWHVHDYLSLRPLVRWLLPALSRYVRGVIAISHSVATDVQRLMPRIPVEVVLNAIDCDRFCPDGPCHDLDTHAGLGPAAPETIRVGLVATYARWKGQEVFLEAAARVRLEQELPPLRFYIIGGPVYRTAGSQYTREELQEIATRLHLVDALGFVGFQPDTAPVYRSLDIVVHASTLPEPFGLTVAEAMACGRATIVSQAGGAAELFREGEDAVGVPPGNVGQLAEAISELTRSPQKRQKLGANAARFARDRFDRTRLGRQVLDGYTRLLSTHRKPGDRLASPQES